MEGPLGQQGGNKVLILASFNPGCKVSEEDLRYLQRVYDLYKDNGLDGICIFTGQSATNRDRAKRFMRNSI
jgi:hypothetical protein